MATLKTTPNRTSVAAFLDGIGDRAMRQDCRAVSLIIETCDRAKPKMWGTSIVGFGDYHYRYASGREGDWFLTGFSPRRQALTLYIMAGFKRYDELMCKLGKYQTGKSCLYVKL